MPPIPTYLTISFLLTLAIPPLASFERGHFTISAFGFPTALSFIPRHVFITTRTPRSWEVARCVQYLVWSWAGLGVLQAVRRTVIRLKRGSLRLDQASGGTDTSPSTKGSTGTNTNTDTSDMKSPSSAPTGPATITPPKYTLSSQSALWTTIILHLISWRLATTLILPDLPGAWKWPFDLTTLIGISTGLICSWGEVWNLLQMTGLAGERDTDTSKKSVMGRVRTILTACLGVHRLWLAVGVLAATMDMSEKGGTIQPLEGTIPA